MTEQKTLRKPQWLKMGIPAGAGFREMSQLIKNNNLHTVCDSAHCPNKAECWQHLHATFMILGDVCTRGCRFCAVQKSSIGTPVNTSEPEQLARVVAELGLRYVVLTSVDRDDLRDHGAGHFADCISAIKSKVTHVHVEILAPDFQEPYIHTVLNAGPRVFAHNIEFVERLQVHRDRRASYQKSLNTLRLAASYTGKSPEPMMVKSSIMLGLGETADEVHKTMDDLLAVGCDSLVLGQYLRPSYRQVALERYISPEEFAAYQKEARARGFKRVVAGPLVRTSYHASPSEFPNG